MRTRLAARLLVLAWMAAVPASVLGQSVDPMPYAEYRVGILAYEQAVEAQPEASGMPTTAYVLAQLNDGQRDAAIELARLQLIVPEVCYAPAHAEYLAFWEMLIARYDALRPQFEAAATIYDMVSLLLAWEAEIRAVHPAAYVAAADALSGYSMRRMNILDTLGASCPDAPPLPVPAMTPAGSAEPT